MSLTDGIGIGIAVLTLATAVLTWQISCRLHRLAKSTDEHVKVLAIAAKVQALGLVAEHLRAMKNGAWNAMLLCERNDQRRSQWMQVADDLGETDHPLTDIEDLIGCDATQTVRLVAGLANGMVEALKPEDEEGHVPDPAQAQRNMESIARHAQPLYAKLNATWREQLAVVHVLQHELREVPTGTKVLPRKRELGDIQGTW